ncbi:GPP34 family phosphoprotein [Enterococcus avium]|uniref:GPP34 family phosphoprotein n=1 Tax=Enterococcus avium TaxID=33945 RepID=UPI003DA43F52
MNNLSLSQQYLLFTMNRQGKISSLNYYVGMCLVMAGLLDLQKANVLELNNKEVILLSNELPEDLQYLDCLLEKITGLKKKRIEAIANAYGTTFFEKDIKQLVSQIRDSLIEAEEVSIKKIRMHLPILLKKSSILKKYIEKENRKILEAKIREAKNEPVSKQTNTMISQLDWLVGAMATITIV